MFDSQEKSTGTQYTLTVALLTVAFVFSPALLLISHPLSPLSVSVAVAGSLVCLALARMSWKKYSNLTIPSIEAPRTAGK